MKGKKAPGATPQQPLFTEGAPAAPGIDLGAVEALAAQLAAAVDALPLAERVRALNLARRLLHAVSPFAAEPVDCVLWLPEEDVEGNTWNPNTVAPPEMVALVHSVEKYGFTMPLVGSWIGADLARIGINDGFHRHLTPKRSPVIAARLHGYLPISVLKGSMTIADRMSATELHNAARGTHEVTREIAIVQALEEAGWTPAEIGLGTVKSDEELVRIRQLGGAADNLAARAYGNAWEF